jgi:hypothetical protein
VLRGDGNGDFTAVPTRESGFQLTGEVRDMETIETARSRLLLVAKNDGPLQVFRYP